MSLNRTAQKYLIGVAFSCGMLLASSMANAATVSCPNTADATDREFTLTTIPGATCFASDDGNINGSGDAINSLGFITLDKTDDTTKGLLGFNISFTGFGLSTGTFSFTAPAGYTDFLIAFKSGSNISPEWAAFLLPLGVTSGTWTISQNSLSHINLYGHIGSGDSNGEVPLPAALPMLLSGLGGLAWLSRRRRNNSAA